LQFLSIFQCRPSLPCRPRRKQTQLQSLPRALLHGSCRPMLCCHTPSRVQAMHLSPRMRSLNFEPI